MKGFETVRSSVVGAAAAVLIAGGISMAFAQQVPLPAQVAPFVPFGDRQQDNRAETLVDDEQDDDTRRYVLIVRTQEAEETGSQATDASYPSSGQQPATPVPATPTPQDAGPEATEDKEPEEPPIPQVPVGPDTITDGSDDPGPDPEYDDTPGDLVNPGVKPETEGGIGDLATPTEKPKPTLNPELIGQIDICKLKDCEPEPKPVLTLEPELVQQPAPKLQPLQPSRSLTR